MIATILPSSAVFHAIDYNERKVARGDATLIEMSNIYGLSGFGPYTPDELRQYMIEYSSRNDRIKKPQFHVAVSCRGHEYSVEQLREFAHRYLEKMGYANDRQPLVIYAHYDTENTHIHIVTSRVAPDGHKIDHNHERRKSQRVVEELGGVDITMETDKTIRDALTYGFSTEGQFRAVLTSLGYESSIGDDRTMRLFRGGVCRKEISPKALDGLLMAQARKQGQPDEKRNKRKKQLRMIFKKFQAMAVDKEDFRKSMRERFGVDIVFHGSKDSPYGYTVIDHKTKNVYAGKEIMNLKQLLSFQSISDKAALACKMVASVMEADRFATTADINKRLRSKIPGACIRKGTLYINKEAAERLDPIICEALANNNRMAHAALYRPSSDAEISVVCKAFRIADAGMFREFLATRHIGCTSRSQARCDTFRAIFGNSSNWSQFMTMSKAEGFSVSKAGNNYYLLDRVTKSIVNVDDLQRGLSQKIESLSASRMSGGHTTLDDKRSNRMNIAQPRSMAEENHHSVSREWEVGTDRNMDDPDLHIRR